MSSFDRDSFAAQQWRRAFEVIAESLALSSREGAFWLVDEPNTMPKAHPGIQRAVRVEYPQLIGNEDLGEWAIAIEPAFERTVSALSLAIRLTGVTGSAEFLIIRNCLSDRDPFLEARDAGGSAQVVSFRCPPVPSTAWVRWRRARAGVLFPIQLRARLQGGVDRPEW